jgi:hypothetical protein
MYNIKCIFIATLLVFAGIAQASTPPKPQVEYSADSVLETANTKMQGHVNYTPTRERREMVMGRGGEKIFMIMRQDKKLAWTLMPSDKMYIETNINQANANASPDASKYKMEYTVIGPDTINGISTTKSKVVMTGPKGEKMDGFMWLSKENIMVKIDATASDKNTRFMTELSNLKIGKQDAKLFEIPAGYEKMSVPGMPGQGAGGGAYNMKDMLKMMK